MLKTNLRFFLRSLLKHRIFTAINVLGLSIGICSCLVIFLITSYQLSFDTFHPDKNRIYRIVGARSGFVQDPLAAAARREIGGLESIAGFYIYYTKVTVPGGSGEPRKFDEPKYGPGNSPIIFTDPQYFDIFSYQWLQGDPAKALSVPFQVVLTESEARKYFGDQPLRNIVGKQVIYADSLRLTVSGIVKDWSGNTDLTFKDFISSSTIRQSFIKSTMGNLENWGMWDNTAEAFVKLPPTTTPARIESQFPAFVKGKPGLDSNTHYYLQPLTDIHFNAQYSDALPPKSHLPTLYTLMGIAAFMLLVAIVNFINLSTAQSVHRSREIGIRKVMGSSRLALVAQFLGETFMLTLLAVCLSLLLIWPVTAAFHSFMPNGLSIASNLLTLKTAVFLALITVVTSVLAGFYPAKVLSSWLPVITLKGQSPTGNNKGYLRRSLIVFQFTVSLVFIIGTMVITRQLRYLIDGDMGLNKDAVVNIDTGYDYPPERRAVLAQKIKGLSGVSAVATSMGTPMADFHNGTDLEYRDNKDIKVDCQMLMGDQGLLSVYDMKLLAGRNLEHSDTMRELLINATCARMLGFTAPADAIGKLAFPGQTDGPHKALPIVGVVADFHAESYREPIKPTFISSQYRASNIISVRLTNKETGLKTTLDKIAGLWHEVYPDAKFEYSFFDDTIAALYEQDQKTGTIVNAAMVISILISCFGLFGLVAFTAVQRTKEIGVRKILGASSARIALLLSKDIMAPVLIATLIASPVAWYFTKEWLQGFVYRVGIGWITFVLAAIAAQLVALISVSLQVVRAANANPVDSLRTE
jgi:putative ABC transport system permease protein